MLLKSCSVENGTSTTLLTTIYPEKGEIKPQVIYRGWYLWKKGRDSWDLDLCKYEDMLKLWQQEGETPGIRRPAASD